MCAFERPENGVKQYAIAFFVLFCFSVNFNGQLILILMHAMKVFAEGGDTKVMLMLNQIMTVMLNLH